MWRIIIFFIPLVVIIANLIFRPGKFLKVIATITYSPLSPFSNSEIPSWASYYLGKSLYEAPPESIKRLEENVRTIGFAMLAVPATLLVILIAL